MRPAGPVGMPITAGRRAAARRRIAALAALLALLAASCLLVSCRKRAAGAPEAAAPLNAALALDYPGLGDGGENDAAWAGFMKAARDAGASLSDGVTSYRFGDRGRMRCLSPKAQGRDRAQVARVLAEGGASPVILVGEAYAEPVKAIAAEFPGALFVLLDVAPRPDYPSNCRFVEFDGRQGAYLAGALAASVSLTNPEAKLGFAGNEEDPESQALSRAWGAGAEAEDPGFAKPGRLPSRSVRAEVQAGKKTVKGTSPDEVLAQLEKAGATTVFWAAGEPDQGILERAKADGVLLVCYPEDLAARLAARGGPRDGKAPQAILASAVKRFDVAVGVALRTYADRAASPPSSLSLGIKEGCVELSVNESQRSLADPRMASVEKAAAAIAAGRADLSGGSEEAKP